LFSFINIILGFLCIALSLSHLLLHVLLVSLSVIGPGAVLLSHLFI
jgi:hypothetical protein